MLQENNLKHVKVKVKHLQKNLNIIFSEVASTVPRLLYNTIVVCLGLKHAVQDNLNKKRFPMQKWVKIFKSRVERLLTDWRVSFQANGIYSCTSSFTFYFSSFF